MYTLYAVTTNYSLRELACGDSNYILRQMENLSLNNGELFLICKDGVRVSPYSLI